jgi:hypothetical protein
MALRDDDDDEDEDDEDESNANDKYPIASVMQLPTGCRILLKCMQISS